MNSVAMPLDQVILGDCVEVLAQLPERSVDLIFADPPYNLQLRQELWRPNLTRVDAVNEDWDRFASFAEYDAFTRAWLGACRRVLKDTGAIWVIGTYHNIYRVGAILQDLGFWILNDVVWVKKNPMPNFRGVRFTNAHETLIWAQKIRGNRYTFHHQLMKAMNGNLQMRSDWRLPICSGKERIRINGKKAHTTQKPEALLERVILASSNPGDLILDPFFGTGTTGAVAKRLGRHWIGIERDPRYVEIAIRRLESIPSALMQEAPVNPASKPARVSMAELVRSGLLRVGQELYLDHDRQMVAQVQPDGSLQFHNMNGSIHQISRQLKRAPVNGWVQWYYYDEIQRELQPIDRLRQQYRQMLQSETQAEAGGLE